MTNQWTSGWTEDQENYFLAGKSNQEIVELTGRSLDSVDRKRRRLIASGRLERVGELARRGVDRAKEDLIRRAEIRELAALRNEQAQTQLLLDTISAGMARMPEFKVPELPNLGLSTHDEETAVLKISDVHVGKLVDPEQVGENFAYNTPMFKERLEKLQQSLLEIIDIHRRVYPVKNIHVLFEGDLIDNSDMRESQKVRIDLTVGNQVLALVAGFVPFLTTLAQSFENVYVTGVGGNHGRIGKFGVNLSVDNLDVLSMHMMEVALDNVPNVHWNISHKPYALVELIPGFEAYVAHGESIRGGGGFAGIPAYGVARAAARDTGIHRRLFDLYSIAHFHSPQDLDINGSHIMINGCWDGGDDFSVNQLHLASEPSQWLFGLHPRRGITWRYQLQLADTRKRDPSPIFSFEGDD